MPGAAGGDLDHKAFNVQENCIYLVLAVLGALLWGYVVGTWVSILTNSNTETRWFHRTMDSLNHFCAQYHLPSEMRIRLREYFQQVPSQGSKSREGLETAEGRWRRC